MTSLNYWSIASLTLFFTNVEKGKIILDRNITDKKDCFPILGKEMWVNIAEIHVALYLCGVHFVFFCAYRATVSCFML